MKEHEEICNLPLISIILFLFLHVFLLSKALHFDYTQMYIMNQRKTAYKKKNLYFRNICIFNRQSSFLRMLCYALLFWYF